MSDAIIVRRGSTGGLSPRAAVVHVSAPAGSTITFVKSGITVKTLGPEKSHIKITDNNYADWYWNIVPANYGNWTITATFGNVNLIETITVNTNKHYDVMLFNGELYNKGDEYVGVTGGWITTTAIWYSNYTSGTPTVQRGETSITITNNTGNTTTGALSTANKIDKTNFTVLKINVKNAYSYNNEHIYLALSPLKTGSVNSIAAASRTIPSVTNTEYSLDLSNVSDGKYYILILLEFLNNQQPTIEFDRIWME